MFSPFLSSLRTLRLLLLFLLTTLCKLNAGLLVYEGFEYPVQESVVGQSGGRGFGDEWLRRYSGNADGVVVPSLSFSDYPVLGAAALFHSERSQESKPNVTRLLDAPFPASPEPVWMSYLFSYNVKPGTAPAFYAGVNTGNNRYPDEVRFSVAALHGGEKLGAIYQNPGTGGTMAMSPDKTYLLIGKYVGSSGVTVWALTLNDYEAIKADGITEEELDAHNSGKAVDKAVEGENEDDSLLPYLSLGATTFGENSTLDATYDEIKMGTTLSDVISPPPHPKR